MKNELKESPLELLWEMKLKEDIDGMAISTSGNCIIVDASGHIYCFDKEGKILWEYETKEIDKKFDILMSSNEDNILASIYPKYKHVCYIFNTSGTYKYKEDCIHHFDVSLSNGYAVVSTKDNKIFFFDKKNKLEEYITDSKTIVCISRSGEYIVAGSEKGTIYFFNKNGKLLWKYNLKSSIFQISLSFDGKYLGVCTGEKKDELYFFDMEGRLIWNYKNKVINIKIEGVSSYGHCIITGLKLTTPKHDKIITVEDREYVVHVQDAYTTQICYFDDNGLLQWKLEGDEYRLSFSGIVISPEFEYIGLTVKVYQTAKDIYYEIWFIDKNGKILWKYKTMEDAHVESITKKGDIITALDGNGWWYLFNKSGKLFFKDYFPIDKNTIEYPKHEEYTDIRVSTNGKYLVAQYGNGIQLFRIKIQ